jgi:hypothetical protein
MIYRPEIMFFKAPQSPSSQPLISYFLRPSGIVTVDHECSRCFCPCFKKKARTETKPISLGGPNLPDGNGILSQPQSPTLHLPNKLSTVPGRDLIHQPRPQIMNYNQPPHQPISQHMKMENEEWTTTNERDIHDGYAVSLQL